MVAGRERIARAVNAYVARRLHPLEQQVNETRTEIADLRARVEALETSLRSTTRALTGTIDMLARRTQDSGPIRCLFLVHYMEAWDSIGDMYEEMVRADDFEPLELGRCAEPAGATRDLPGTRRPPAS